MGRFREGTRPTRKKVFPTPMWAPCAITARGLHNSFPIENLFISEILSPVNAGFAALAPFTPGGVDTVD